MTTRTKRRIRVPADEFEHGDPRRYRRGCHCKACTDAVTAETRIGGYMRATGRGVLTTPDAAAERIHLLRTRGLSDGDILNAADIGSDQLYRIIRRTGRIHRNTEQLILSIPVPESSPVTAGACIAGRGTTLRLRAAAADGWPAAELGRRTGRYKQFIVHLQSLPLDSRVRMWVADDMRRLFDEIVNLSPETCVPAHICRRTRDRAASKGWVPARYWDPEDFDDPDFVPAVEATTAVRELAAIRRAEIEHLASYGETPEEILRRLPDDISLSTVQAIVREHLTGRRPVRGQAKAVAA